jgi:hypothetical protein
MRQERDLAGAYSTPPANHVLTEVWSGQSPLSMPTLRKDYSANDAPSSTAAVAEMVNVKTKIPQTFLRRFDQVASGPTLDATPAIDGTGRPPPPPTSGTGTRNLTQAIDPG